MPATGNGGNFRAQGARFGRTWRTGQRTMAHCAFVSSGVKEMLGRSRLLTVTPAALNMTIDRERGDLRRIDFSDAASGRRLPPVHRGAILRDGFVQPMQLGVHRLARGLEVSRPRLNEIVHGCRAATTDTALRLARYFGTTPEFRINLQTRYDLDVAERAVRHTIDRGAAPRAARRLPIRKRSNRQRNSTRKFSLFYRSRQNASDRPALHFRTERQPVLRGR